MRNKNNRIFIWTVILFFSVTGVIVTLGHYAPQPSEAYVLEYQPAPSPAWYLEQLPKYAQNAMITLLHIVPSLVFMLLAPLQLMTRLRKKLPGLHRWTGRLFILLSGLIAISAVLLAWIMPFGGIDETVVTIIMSILFLISLSMGVIKIRQGNVRQHRIWMLRLLAIGFAPVTMRFYFAIGFGILDLDAATIFAESVALGLITNLLVLHLWLNKNTKQVSGVLTQGLVENHQRGN